MLPSRRMQVDFWWVMERSSLRQLGWMRTYMQGWRRVGDEEKEWSTMVEQRRGPRHQMDMERLEAR